MRFARYMLPLFLVAAHAVGAELYKPAAGPATVATYEADWIDASRSTTVPVKIYFPKNLADSKAPAPLIIFSHGLSGSREGYQMWSEHWASCGYIVVNPTHVGSDSSIITGGMTGMVSAASPQNALRRTQDVSFVIDQMQKANDGTLADKTLAALKGKIDMHHIGMSGHSFGAVTTLMVSGEITGGQRSFTDPRITAAIAMSPQPSFAPNQKTAFGSIKIPLLHITGTNDDTPAPLGNVKAADRRVPFDNSTFPNTFLITFAGATHMTFSPTSGGTTIGARLRQMRDPSTNTPQEEAAIHTLVEESTTAFWDAYLKSDDKAKTWLKTDLPKALGTVGKLETKSPK